MTRTASLLLASALASAAPSCVIELGDWSGPKLTKDVELTHLPSGRLQEVFVDSYNGSITVTAAPGGEVRGTSRLHARGRDEATAQERLDSMRWSIEEQAGGRLVLRLSEPSSGGRNNAGGSAELSVPAGVRVLVDSSNGAVNVMGDFPYAWVDTSNGPVTVDGAREVEVDTGNGAVRIHGADGKVVADTSNGPVEYVGASPDFVLDSSNGNVVVRLTGDWSGKGHVDTSNGSVTVECAGVMDCAMDASTSNGKVRLTGPTLDSGRGSLRLDTSNGSITVAHGKGE